jgi:competence protein ComEA
MFRFFSVVFAALFMTLTALAGVNVNTASESDLTGLPGIGPAKAAAIVQYRSQNGPFKSLADLDAVSGIGPATLANITPMVVFSADGTAPPAPPAQANTGKPAQDAININAADAVSLQSLPGIGPSKAAAILADRKTNGPFASCADLQRVRGVGTATVSSIATICTIK